MGWASWVMWFFTADVWLLHKMAESDVVVPVLLAIGSAILNTRISAVTFFFLVYLARKIVRPNHQFLEIIRCQIELYLARQQTSSQTMIEAWRQHKYLIIVIANAIPFVPWISGGTTLYAILTRDLKALSLVVLGLAMKSVVMGMIFSFIH